MFLCSGSTSLTHTVPASATPRGSFVLVALLTRTHFTASAATGFSLFCLAASRARLHTVGLDLCSPVFTASRWLTLSRGLAELLAGAQDMKHAALAWLKYSPLLGSKTLWPRHAYSPSVICLWPTAPILKYNFRWLTWAFLTTVQVRAFLTTTQVPGFANCTSGGN